VHSRTVIAEERLWHEGGSFTVLISSIANYVFEYLQVVCSAEQGRIPEINFTLARSCYFVVMTLNPDA
jgi:hypothetical protein